MKATLHQKSYTEMPDNEYEVEIEDKCVAKWDEGLICGGEVVWKRDYGFCKTCGVTYEVIRKLKPMGEFHRLS